MSSVISAEQAVIGCCLVSAKSFWEVADLLQPEDFQHPAHRELWRILSDNLREQKECDFITIGESRPDLYPAATAASNSPFSLVNVRAYAKWVLNEVTKRKVVLAGQQISKLSGQNVLAEAQQILGACLPRAQGEVHSLKHFVLQNREQMHKRYEETGAITGVPTSLPFLDDLISGWQPSDLIVLAARPSLGKTALALQFLIHAALHGHPGYFASLEQSGLQISQRAVSWSSKVALTSIINPKKITDEEWPLVTDAEKTLLAVPLEIDDTSAIGIDALGARFRQAHAKRKLKLGAIDYLQRMNMPNADNEAGAIQIVTRSLKSLAKELNIPLLLLSQLNREGDDRPKLKHLRGSGAIEQDADIVIFLHRPNEDRDLIELIVEKNRNGPCESHFLESKLAYMRFYETDERPEAPSVKKRAFGRRSA